MHELQCNAIRHATLAVFKCLVSSLIRNVILHHIINQA